MPPLRSACPQLSRQPSDDPRPWPRSRPSEQRPAAHRPGRCRRWRRQQAHQAEPRVQWMGCGSAGDRSWAKLFDEFYPRPRRDWPRDRPGRTSRARTNKASRPTAPGCFPNAGPGFSRPGFRVPFEERRGRWRRDRPGRWLWAACTYFAGRLLSARSLPMPLPPMNLRSVVDHQQLIPGPR